MVLVIIILRFVPPPTTSFMLLRHVERAFESASGPPILYEWTPLSRISPGMALAAVAAEDQNFPHHWGFDLEAIARAMKHNEKHSRIRGASTISQQVAKNLFLWPGRSFLRKGLEAGLTILIEAIWPKRRILEVYLNIAEFGDSTYGVNAAARRYFGKAPHQLSLYESALLASTLPNPRKLAPHRPSPYLMHRARWVQNQIQQLGSEYLDLR